jgi:hypothetical protein
MSTIIITINVSFSVSASLNLSAIIGYIRFNR